LASDLYGRCDDNKKDNGYAILVLNVSTGAVVARRTIPAAPNSLYLVINVDKQPVLISKRSLQVLDSKSLETIRTIDFQDSHANALTSPHPSDEEDICSTRPFRVSVTPDTSRIEVEIPHHAEKNTDLITIDGRTLEFVQTLVPGFVPEFRIGFRGVYEHKQRRQWYWSDGAEDTQLCDICDYLDVLSPHSIVIGTDNQLSVQVEGATAWKTHFAGMRDDFSASSNGDSFVVLSSGGNGLFRGGLSFSAAIFGVSGRNVRRLPSISVHETGPIEGGIRTTVAMSEDGSQVAAFVNGRISFYDLR
jgi:hypothetical protein